MTVKELCAVMFDNQSVEIYVENPKYGAEPVCCSTVAKMKHNTDWCNEEVHTVMSGVNSILIYVWCN